MTRPITVMIFVVAICFLAVQGPILTAADDPHAYFNTLTARSDHWKSYSLRDPRQLDSPNNGGYAHSNSRPLVVTYDPRADRDPHAQDAAKVVIPAFTDTTTLAGSMGSSDLYLPVATYSGSIYGPRRAVRVGNEIMTVNRPSGTVVENNLVPVLRGQHGTTPAAHTPGATVSVSVNSLSNTVRLPLFTEDRHTYFFVWEAYWTDSYVGSGLENHKAFQFARDGDRVWLEPQTRFSGLMAPEFDRSTDVATVTLRSYNPIGGDANWSATDGTKAGPGVTKVDPILPIVGSFTIKPNRWTRFFVRIEQRANDYDYVDYWVADEATNPVQIYSRIPVSLPSPNTIERFWLEFNTSTDMFTRSDMRDLVAYVRNVAVLRDVADVRPLFQRPLAGTPVQTSTLSPPQNLRIVR
jgi:hypothetical protein